MSSPAAYTTCFVCHRLQLLKCRALQVRCVVVYSEALQETKERDVDMEDEQVKLCSYKTASKGFELVYFQPSL
jgi:hypothetical protein